MKKSLVFAFVLWATFNNNFAQNMRPLTGNGTEKKISYDIQIPLSVECYDYLYCNSIVQIGRAHV